MRNTFSDFMPEQAAATEELFPGVMERRWFLRGSVVSAAAILALGVPNGVAAQATAKGPGT